MFGVTTSIPKRVLRDVRNRILAIEWIHFIATIVYGCLFALSITSFDYSLANPPDGSPIRISVALFLMGKTVSSLVIFLGLLSDTDVILGLAYFGCLGFCMKYVKEYTRKKREEYGGWPLAYAYNKCRFYVICFLKVGDVAWGVIGWIIMGKMLGKFWLQSNAALQTVLMSIWMSMVFTDFWTSILFYITVWLIKVHKRLDELDEGGDSDDSELDDFGVRTPLASPKEKVSQSSSAKSRAKALAYSSESSESSSSESEESEDISRSTASYLKHLSSSPMHSPTKLPPPPNGLSEGDVRIDFAPPTRPDSQDFMEDYRRVAGVREQDYSIIMDPYASVVPEEFSDMWSTLR